MQKIVKARFLCTERKFKTMSQHLLDIENLTVAVEDKEILHGVNLQVNEGETHVLMGPNGAGKSTLGYALMGNPQYKVTCLLYTSPSPPDLRRSRMPSSA